MTEFKVGDKVRLEGVITEIDPDEDVLVMLDGGNEETLITKDEMAHATLIEPAEEEKVQELDLSKPVRVRSRPDEKVVSIFGPNSHDYYMVEFERGSVDLRFGGEIENIPEPKRRFSRQSVLVTSLGGAEPYLTWDNCIPHGSTTIAHINLIHTEGEGWSIEEIK